MDFFEAKLCNIYLLICDLRIKDKNLLVCDLRTGIPKKFEDLR
jgi:hypothetical protein